MWWIIILYLLFGGSCGDCGGGCGGCGGGCGNNSIWIIILIILFGGFNGGGCGYQETSPCGC